MINTRQVSWEMLHKVIYEGAFSNILLNDLSDKPEIDQHAKNFIFALTLGTINKKIYLEHVVNKFIDANKTPEEIKVLLWMSVYQIKFMNKIPVYAVVNEAVELAKKVNQKFAGFVNGTLKSLIAKKEEAFIVNAADPKEKFCIENAFPFDLYKLIEKEQGVDNAQLFVVNSNKIPEIDIRVNTLKIGFDLKDALTVKKIVVKSKIYQDGLVTIQDKASILVSQILKPVQNSRVLDMCAAPGGKLTHLAALMQNTGYIKAYEISGNRIPLIEANIERLNARNIELVHDDARNAVNDDPYDYILLDAPCSGFGVIKRKPEIKLNIDLQSLPKLYKTQAELLETAYRVLKTNGTLVYSTCTINRAENEAQIEKFLANHPDISVIHQQQLVGHEYNSDAFFICKMVKN